MEFELAMNEGRASKTYTRLVVPTTYGRGIVSIWV